jgi:hypothetical protein
MADDAAMAAGALALTRELGATPPPGLIASLDDAELGRLAEAVRGARVREVAALRRAADDGLRFVPALLRGTVRRMVGL